MNKIAFITGASSGIGMASAKALALAGFDLVICGRRESRLQALKAELEVFVKVHMLVFDVANKDTVFSAIESLPADFKNIFLLLNNAGNAHGLSAIHEGDLGDWQSMIDSNISGLLHVSRAIMPGLVERKSGHIINLSSVAGKYTYENGAVYCATKKAVEALSEGMRLDLTKFGIKVSNIAPGAVNTEFSLVRFKGDTARAASIYDGFDPILPQDIADAVVYIATAPNHVNIADMTIYAKMQAAPTIIYRNTGL